MADRLLHATASPGGEIPHGRLGRRPRRAAAHPGGVCPGLPLAVTRRTFAVALLLAALAASASAQLVPVTQCNAAIPCSIPMGLRPADAAAWTPGANVGHGNAVMSVSAGIEEGLKPKIDVPHVSEDPAEMAARLFVKRNPLPTPKPTPTPKGK